MDGFTKFIEVLETILGINALSSTTLRRSKTGMAFLAFWVVTYAWEILQLMASDIRNEGVSIFLAVSHYLTVAITFYKSLVGRQRLVSSSITIEAAKTQLVAAGLDIVPRKPLDLVVMAVPVLHVATISGGVIINLAKPFGLASGIILLARVHSIVMQMVLTIGFLNLKCCCKRIHRTFNKSLDGLRNESDVEEVMEIIHNINRRPTRGTLGRVHIQILDLLRKIRPELVDTEKEINAHYHYLVIGRVIDMAWSSPNIFCVVQRLLEEEWLYKMFLVTSMATLVAFIYTSVDGAKEKQLSAVTLRQLHTTSDQAHRTTVTWHLLSTMHSTEVDSCLILDLDYSLVLDVLDYAILVFTTMCHK